MIRIRVSQFINRPVAEVFQLAGNFQYDALWRAGVVAIQAQGGGLPFPGMQVQEALSFMGTSLITKMELEAVEPNRRLAFRTLDSGMPFSGQRLFEPQGEGTRLTYELTLQPTGIYQLLPALTEELFTQHLKDSLTGLKRRLEGRVVRRVFPLVGEPVIG
ncbi:SRPBCC family protein [Tellurirhabdus rosea]|uniref:SRPBCC family protein n=1 Tax=Tellurirhabdus rosea TaxID=2674997 RepID=UPI0022598C6F|nr:SRPBCC family protein [Tellurirhabdus rosea]